jgi:hypothetical protein
MGFRAFDIAPFPAELVHRFLGITAAEGIVHFSAAGQDHAFERHGDVFLGCLEHLEMTMCCPQFIGQSPGHPAEFELVREASGVGFVLAALPLECDDEGRYVVRSLYAIGYPTIQRRLRKGHLFQVC